MSTIIFCCCEFVICLFVWCDNCPIGIAHRIPQLRPDKRHRIDLNLGAERQFHDADGDASWKRHIEILGHGFFVDAGEMCKIGKENVKFDDVGQRSVGNLCDFSDVVEDAGNLGIDAVNQLYGCQIEADLTGQINRVADRTPCE